MQCSLAYGIARAPPCPDPLYPLAGKQDTIFLSARAAEPTSPPPPPCCLSKSRVCYCNSATLAKIL